MVAAAGFPMRPSAEERIDLFWEKTLWSLHSLAVWEGRKDILDRVKPHPVTGIPLDASASSMRRAERIDQDAKGIWSLKQRKEFLPILGSLWMWRVLTDEQLVALTGIPKQTILRRCRVLMAGGLVEQGGMLTHRSKPIGPTLWKISRSPEMDDFLSAISFKEQAGITAGKQARPSSFSDRHDLLANELMLRGIEFWPEELHGTWVGETVSPLGVVSQSGLNDQGSNADLVFVRYDGLRVAFEIIGSASGVTDAARKAERWIQHLISGANDCVVVWVDASERNIRALYKRLSRVLDEVPMGQRRNHVLRSFCVAKWSDWFPDYGIVSQDFMDFAVTVPTGQGGQVKRWQQASLWKKQVSSQPDGWVDVIQNTNMLYGTPSQLRLPELAPKLTSLQNAAS